MAGAGFLRGMRRMRVGFQTEFKPRDSLKAKPLLNQSALRTLRTLRAFIAHATSFTRQRLFLLWLSL